MRAHAQEFDDEVLMHHVELYVNEHTNALGQVGARALEMLPERASAAGLLEANTAPLSILGA
jgi:1,4-dihydroxy-6-naphthoate synthase